ncbi:MAG: protein kinase [Ignavibacteriaceae bacterium]
MIGRIVQNYKIISLLGEGGMGAVYKALDFKLDRYVAIKVLKRYEITNQLFIERFKREAKNQAKLSHPNIVSVYGFVESKDFLGFVMEYIEGKTVEEYLNEYGRLSLNDSIKIIKQVLIGTDYAHSEGFIHRDLKPSNIIIDSKGVVKIMDFGIAKSMNESMSITKAGSKVGTILYMSPEQVRGFDSTIKSDLYSLAISLYEMISGKVPYDFPNEYEILDAHLNQIPAPISMEFPEVPPVIDEVILRAMNKASSGNYNSCNEFIYELDQLEHSLPVYNKGSGNIENRIEISSPSKKPTIGRRILNFFLFVIFLSLLVYSFKAVTDYFVLQEKLELEKKDNSKLGTGPFSTIKTDWQKINIPTSENINAISTQNNTIVLAGNKGIILRSSNSGKSWRRIEAGIKSNLYSIISSTFDNLVIVGERGVILLSTDAGQTWQRKNSDTDKSLFRVKSFRNRIYITGSEGTLLVCNNTIDDVKALNKPVNSILYDIYFLNTLSGFVIGWDGALLHTSDGGTSWTKKVKLTGDYFRSITFINEKTGIIVGGGGTILRSNDSGLNWEPISSITISSFNKVLSLNDEIVIAVTNKGEIFQSLDYGLNWQISNSGVFTMLTDIIQSSDGNIYITGNNGTLLRNRIEK